MVVWVAQLLTFELAGVQQLQLINIRGSFDK